MSGIKYLLDSNILLGLVNGHAPALALVNDQSFNECGVSVVTRMELLGYPHISTQELRHIAELLSCLVKFSLDDAVEEQVIAIRQQRKVKLPDAIICATAVVHDLQLITLDQKLMRIYEQCQ